MSVTPRADELLIELLGASNEREKRVPEPRVRHGASANTVPLLYVPPSLAVERAVCIDHAGVWDATIGSIAKAVEHFLRAVRRDAKDRPAAVLDGSAIIRPAMTCRAESGRIPISQPDSNY